MPIQSYSTFVKFTSWCKTRLPAALQADLRAVKDDDAVRTHITRALCFAYCLLYSRPSPSSSSSSSFFVPCATYLHTYTNVHTYMPQQAVRDLGTALAVSHCKQLLASGQQSLHFYTMNLAQCVTAALEGLDLVPEEEEEEEEDEEGEGEGEGEEEERKERGAVVLQEHRV